MKPPQIELPFATGLGLEGLLGLEFTELSGELVRSRMEVRDELRQPTGLIHGGVYAAIAESLASWGTAAVVVPEGKTAVGLSNQTSFLRPITEGHINAVASRKHRGRTTWVWEVELYDDQDRLCALARVTIAVRDA
jgi:1,4-dihydroxy-2-naphthoyl-CoA hydrolase